MEINEMEIHETLVMSVCQKYFTIIHMYKDQMHVVFLPLFLPVG